MNGPIEHPLCASCKAACCRWEAEVNPPDEVPDEMTDVSGWGHLVMARLADGYCIALDRETMRCKIYANRPKACRDFPIESNGCYQARAMCGLPVPDSFFDTATASIEENR